MSKNKVTLRDIAKECNVSVATVCYVLNHSEKEKISHDTRLKIAETATRLHYIPNTVSKRRIDRRSNLIGIIINLKEENTSSKKIYYSDLAAEISREMQKLGFESLLIQTKDLANDLNVIAKHSLDAVFMIDADSHVVKKITQNYYVPIIFIDCVINDALFCSIYPDYPGLIKKSKEILNTDSPFIMMEDICNQEIKELIKSQFYNKDLFINTPEVNIKSFLQMHKDCKGIILGDILGLEVEKIFDNRNIVVMSYLCDNSLLLPSTPKIYVKNKTIAAVATSIFNDMLSLSYVSPGQNKVLVECETQP